MLCTIDVFQIGNARLDDAQKEQERRTHRNIDADSLLGYRVVDFTFTEELLKPNEFTFTLRRESLVKNDNTNSYQIVDVILGKPVTCQLTMAGNQFTIEGKIAKVSMKGLSVTCVAYGTEAELQGAPRCRCFFGKKLEDIVKEVLVAYKDNNNHDIFGNRTIDIHTDFKDIVLPYVVQYNESDYDFLVRLAKRFGAFFYYNPKTKVLNFGKIPTTDVEYSLTRDPIQHRHGDVASVSYELEMIDSGFRNVAYHDEKGAVLSSVVPKINTFIKVALMEKVVKSSNDAQADTTLFYDDPNRLPYNPSTMMMNKYAKDLSSGMLGNNTACYFTCYNLNVHVGNVVKVDGNGPVLVTSAKFTWESDGSFQSENKAMLVLGDAVGPLPVTADAVFAPYMDINAFPRSSAQRAIVVDNVDPLKMGRVLVRFAWQDVGVAANYAVPGDDTDQNMEKRKQYPWVRIAQPYGGGNKGCYILPEIGEEVMVGFENDNMEKPFVIGSLFHDSAKPAEKQMPDDSWVETRGRMVPNGQHPANKGNEVKAFRTKKGHTIEFHDVDGDQNYGFIRIYNKNKPNDHSYEIVLSPDKIQVPNPQSNDKEDYKWKGPKTENIATGENIEEADYTAQNLRLMVRSYGGDIVLDAGDGDIIMNAKNIRVHATGDATTLIDQKNIMKVKDGQFVDVGFNSLVSQGKQNIVVKAEETEYYSKKVIMNIEQPFVMQSYGDENFQLSIDAKSLTTETTGKTKINAPNLQVVTDDSIELDGGSKAELKAANVTINGQTKAELKGADIDLQGAESISAKSGKIGLTSPSGSLEGAWKWP